MSTKKRFNRFPLPGTLWMGRRMRPDSLLPAILFLATLLLIAGCNSSAPDDLIEENQYINLLAEMHLLAAMREITDDDEKFRKGQDLVLEHYNITRDQFERSHDYYFQDAREQQRRLRDVRRRLEEISSELSDYEQQMHEKPDTDPSSESGPDPD